MSASRHRERPGAAGRLVVLLRPLDEPLDDRLRAVQPLVVDPPPPDDHRERARRGRARARTLRSAATGLAKNIVPKRENARSKRSLERHRLRVGDDEAHVGDAGLRRLARRRLDEARRGVDADRLAVRADERRDLLRRVAEAAADVEDALARLRREEPSASSPCAPSPVVTMCR